MLPFHRLPTMTNTVTVEEPSTFFMSEIADSVQTLKHFKEFHPAFRAEPIIKCGNAKRLWREIETVTGRDIKTEADERPVSSMQFSGVPVVENDIIPANIVIVMMGDEVVNIINLDKPPAHPDTLTDEAKLRRSQALDELGALDGELL